MMKKIISITLALVLVLAAIPAAAKIKIDSLQVFDSVEEVTLVANAVTAVAHSMADPPRTLRLCFSDWEQQICCSYTKDPGGGAYDCELYLVDGGE